MDPLLPEPVRSALPEPAWLGHDFGDKLPSDIFREHSLACYVTDPAALKVRDDIGIDIIAWECDYPHSDSIFPNAPEFVHAELTAAGAPTRRWTRSPGRTPAASSATTRSCTSTGRTPSVGASARSRRDVDTTIRTKHEWRAIYEAQSQLMSGVLPLRRTVLGASSHPGPIWLLY